MPLSDLDWDDVKVFLALLRSRSLRHAADTLGMSHPTVRRRLLALEERLGLHLFERRHDGLHTTVHAQALIASAEAVERAMLDLGRAARAADHELHGPVHVTLPDVLGVDLLMPALVAFSLAWPRIELTLDTTYDLADLGRGEADVAIRAMMHGTKPDERLAGRLAATSYQAAYGQGDHWIGWRGGAYDADWVARSCFPDLPVRGAIGNPILQREACKQGLGVALLPCHLAEPALVRRCEPEPSFDIWVLVHPDLRKNPRLRIFRDAMVQALVGLQGRLAGQPGPVQLASSSATP